MHRRRLFSGLRSLGQAANTVIRHVLVWFAQALVLTFLIGVFTQDAVPTYTEALVGIVLIAAINTAIMPSLIRLVVRFRAWLFPVITFLLNAAMLLLADRLLPGWRVSGVLEAGLLALVLTGTSAFMGTLLSISDDGAWRRYALGPLRARYQRYEPLRDQTPGFAFLEIDGLSEPILREAMERGYAPYLKSWLESGSHTLAPWECDLSSQTSASQAGILLGTNHDIPAFRWYDKRQGRVMVSNRPRDAAAIQRKHSTGDGLLANNGASRGNLFSGDAPDSLFTIASIVLPAQSNTGSYYFFWANLYNLARTFALFVADVVREVAAAIWQIIRNERPRVRRFGIYPLLRAATTSLLRELSTFTVAGDLMRGVPAIYTTYIAYDEVAHHSGVARGDTLRVLRDIDRDIGRLQRVAAEAPRPYHLVVLSDHGQSQGATFLQRYGMTLGDLVETLISAEDEVREHISTDEGWPALSALLTDVLARGRGERSGLKRSVTERLQEGEVTLGPDASPYIRLPKRENGGGDVIVLASGNLGLISFPELEGRLMLEEIEAEHPALVSGLARHPGVGFVMVRSSNLGPVVIGADGLHILRSGEVQGSDPLLPFGEGAVKHLLRASRFTNAPDILVNSMVDPKTGEVAAFEELVGSHGGLGGGQTSAFILYPASLSVNQSPLVGAEHLHAELMRWMRDAREAPDA